MKPPKTSHSKPAPTNRGNYLDKKRRPWPQDAPEGKCWKCPDCKSWATLGDNAGFHMDKKGHGEPTLVDLEPVLDAARAAMQLKRERQRKPSMQSLGGRARAAALTPERRKEIAATASAKRWRGKEQHDAAARKKCAICRQPRHRHT